ncbi:hypothetical protein [Mucilaginibacter sp.]
MSSYTTISTKELIVVSEDISFCKYLDFYCYTFDSDFWEMLDMLATCKTSYNVIAATLPGLKPVSEILEKLNKQDYLIDYVNDFANMPDESCFTLPVLNGKIVNEYIVDENNRNKVSIKAAYSIVNLKIPDEY